MIKLKNQVDKAKLFRELQYQAHKIHQHADHYELRMKMRIKGAEACFNRLRQTTKPNKITAREYLGKYFYQTDYAIEDEYDKHIKQFDYHDLIDFAEQYLKENQKQ